MAKKEETKKVNKKTVKQMDEEVVEEINSEQEVDKEDEKVTIPLKDFENQLREIDELKEQADEFSDGWQRERADFDNYRKRVARDREQEIQNIRVDIVKKYLTIHDDLERAISANLDEDGLEKWVEGITLIQQKMKKILDTEGLEVIMGDGETFDPKVHEAITHEENKKFKSGQIIEVVQQGYKIGERVIKPALVRVAK